MRSCRSSVTLLAASALIVSAMLPLVLYDSGVNANDELNRGTGKEDDPFMIYSAEDLSMVGNGPDGTEYEGWSMDAHYKLGGDIDFGDKNTNGGIIVDINIIYNAGQFIITLTPPPDTMLMSILVTIMPQEGHHDTHIIIYPLEDPVYVLVDDPGTYIMVVGGTYYNEGITGTFAYTCEVDIPDDADYRYEVTDTFDSNGNFDPIGTLSKPFTGTFNGDGYKISGINVSLYSSTNGYAGIFGYTENVRISNVIVTNSSFAIVSETEVHAGGVTGRLALYSQITDCYNESKVLAVSTINVYAGGVAGSIYSYFPMINCYNTGNVTASSGSYAYAGGITAGAQGGVIPPQISGCSNTGNITVSASGDACAGGIIGISNLSGVSIVDCYNTGEINVSSYLDAYGGGMSGDIRSASSCINCYNTGNVTVSASYKAYAGGIVAIIGSFVINSYNTGNVTVVSLSVVYAGGVIGHTNSTVMNCYNTGNVTVSASSEAYAGGIAGLLYTSAISYIIWCYNTGNISAAASTVYAGGVSGYAENLMLFLIISSYFLEDGSLELTGNDSPFSDGISGPRSAVEMKKRETYKNWDFGTTWRIIRDINDGFPVFFGFLHIVLVNSPENGSITSPNMVQGGADVYVAIRPDEGYRTKSLIDNSNDVTDQVFGDVYVINSISSDHNIVVEFESTVAPGSDTFENDAEDDIGSRIKNRNILPIVTSSALAASVISAMVISIRRP